MTRDLHRGHVHTPTESGACHEWAYLPDLAAVTLELLERGNELGALETFHFRGHRLTMSELLEALGSVTGGRLKKKPFPWALLRVVSPLWKMGRELVEMRYLWEEPVLLDDSKLRQFLGDTRRTPLTEALRASLVRAPSAGPQRMVA